MGWTKKEEAALKANGMRQSSSDDDKYVGRNGYGSAKRVGSYTIFGDGDKKHDISLDRLREKTKR